jgi:hypothetical protein
VKVLVLTVAVLATGCAADAHSSLRRDMARIVPDASKQQGKCDYASGFAEDAPPALRCWFVVRGRVPEVTANLERNLRAAGLRVSAQTPGGPAARVLNGVNEKSAVSVSVIASGRPLFFQLGKDPVAEGHAGIDITVARRK